MTASSQSEVCVERHPGRWIVLYVCGLAVPWAATFLPFEARLALCAVLGLLGLGLLLRGLQGSSGQRVLLAAAWVLAFSGATCWIAVASFSAQLSRLPHILLLGGLSFAVLAWGGGFVCFCRRYRGRRWLSLSAYALLAASIWFAPPGRRYLLYPYEDFSAYAETLNNAREATYWVHERIERRRGPFTDTAQDTLRRGHATCGGMANLLDKVLRAQGYRSRIVHIEGEAGIHTLVEYMSMPDGQWLLADPQNRLMGEDWGRASGWTLVNPEAGKTLPDRWRGFEKLYIYKPLRGYVLVTSDTYPMFYATWIGGRASDAGFRP